MVYTNNKNKKTGLEETYRIRHTDGERRGKTIFGDLRGSFYAQR